MNFEKILVPVKGDPTSEDAFRLACGLSKEHKATLYALYVIEVPQDLPLDAEVESAYGEATLRRIEAVSQEEKCRVKAEYLQARYAGPAVTQETLERGIDLIVLGISYKQRFGRFTLGETASYILKNAPCPVILWREQSRATSLARG